jgi:Flp pilus assembly pilin Flp
MKRFLKNLWSEQEGQNLPEFALLLFLVCLTAVSAMGSVAMKVDSMYANVSTHVAAASNPALTGGSISFSTGTPAVAQTESKDATQQNSTD